MIKGIHHVSLKTISDTQYQEACAFYENLLKLKVYKKWDKGVMYDTGNGCVEIFNNGLETLDTGAIRHYALEVSDPDALAKQCEDAGFPIIYGPCDVTLPCDPDFHLRVAFVKGPLNEEIEFLKEL